MASRLWSHAMSWDVMCQGRHASICCAHAPMGRWTIPLYVSGARGLDLSGSQEVSGFGFDAFAGLAMEFARFVDVGALALT